MTVRYVDPAASGGNDGTSWTDAWTNVQSAFDTAVAGDEVRCQGTQTLTVTVDVDTNQGDITNGMISFIGTNASGVVDGTRFVMDGNSAAANCILANNIDYIRIENFEFKNATNDGIDTVSTACLGWYFNNCSSNNNTGYGLSGIYLQQSLFFRCTFYSNGSGGHIRCSTSTFYFCSFHDNTGSGANPNGITSIHYIGCLFYDNGDDGHTGLTAYSNMFNCVINGNTDNGIVVLHHKVQIVGCRITNHSGAGDVGLHANTSVVFHGWNYYEDNDGDNIQNATLAIEILDAGASTDQEDQADTNEGYTDLTDGAEDFSLRDDATSRRTAITVPII